MYHIMVADDLVLLSRKKPTMQVIIWDAGKMPIEKEIVYTYRRVAVWSTVVAETQSAQMFHWLIKQ